MKPTRALAISIGACLFVGAISVPIVGDDDSVQAPPPAPAGDGSRAVGTEAPVSAPSPASGAPPLVARGGVPAPTTAGPSVATSAPPTAVKRTASDRGVTPELIKVGFLLIDVGGLDQIGFAVGITVEQQKAAIRAYVDEINTGGGINGRKLQGFYQPVNLLDRTAGREACLALTEDAKVFAVMGNFTRPEDVLCVTEEHQTFFVSSGQNHPESLYASSAGLMVTIMPRARRMMASWVAELDRIGYIGDKPVGIVTAEDIDPGSTTAQLLNRYLEQAGHRVARITRLSSDLHTGSSQVPVEVTQMRTAGVGVVLFMGNALFSQQFAQEADSQRWFPRYSTSDWASMDTDTSNDNMPSSFEGAVGVTFRRTADEHKVTPEPEKAKECRAIYERRTGRKLPARDANEYNLTLIYCDLLNVFAAGARTAGPQLTRAALREGFPRAGPLVPLANFPGGAFAPGKPDLGDFHRIHRWSFGCSCWQATEQYRRARF